MPNESIERVGDLARDVESIADPLARAAALDLVRGVMALHAETLERVLEIVRVGGDEAALAADDLVAGVLAMHGIHPEDTETRVRRAVEKLRRFFDSRGASIELLASGPDIARVRFTGRKPGAGPAARKAIEDAVYALAPELSRLDIEGVEDPPAAGFVPLDSLLARQA